MLDRVEDHWDLPPAADTSRGLLETDPEKNVHSLWPGAPEGRLKPVFAYRTTEAEYLRREDLSEIKHEFVDGFIYAMAGASAGHNVISNNLVVALHPKLRGSRCRGFSSDMRAAIQETTKKGHPAYYYPDFLITCSKTEMGLDLKVIKEPFLVVEIMSPSTATKDRTEKLINYRHIPTLEHYWLIDQERCRVVVHTRDGDGWRETEHTSIKDVLRLSICGGLEIRLEDIYLDVIDASVAG